jgi:hypothetical protein
MKKILSVLLLMCIFASPVPAGAAGLEAPGDGWDVQQDAGGEFAGDEFDGEQFDEGGDAFLEAPTAGPDQTVEIDGLYTLVLPGILEAVPVDQQDYDDGLLYSAYGDTLSFDVYRYEADGSTLEGMYDDYAMDSEENEVTLGEVNGVKMLVYRIDPTVVGVTIAGADGYLYDLLFAYETHEDYLQVGAVIASIRPAAAQPAASPTAEPTAP